MIRQDLHESCISISTNQNGGFRIVAAYVPEDSTEDSQSSPPPTELLLTAFPFFHPHNESLTRWESSAGPA